MGIEAKLQHTSIVLGGTEEVLHPLAGGGSHGMSVFMILFYSSTSRFNVIY